MSSGERWFPSSVGSISKDALMDVSGGDLASAVDVLRAQGLDDAEIVRAFVAFELLPEGVFDDSANTQEATPSSHPREKGAQAQKGPASGATVTMPESVVDAGPSGPPGPPVRLPDRGSPHSIVPMVASPASISEGSIIGEDEEEEEDEPEVEPIQLTIDAPDPMVLATSQLYAFDGIVDWPPVSALMREEPTLGDAFREGSPCRGP
jgi:hypothetical protein